MEPKVSCSFILEIAYIYFRCFNTVRYCTLSNGETKGTFEGLVGDSPEETPLNHIVLRYFSKLMNFTKIERMIRTHTFIELVLFHRSTIIVDLIENKIYVEYWRENVRKHKRITASQFVGLMAYEDQRIQSIDKGEYNFEEDKKFYNELLTAI